AQRSSEHGRARLPAPELDIRQAEHAQIPPRRAHEIEAVDVVDGRAIVAAQELEPGAHPIPLTRRDELEVEVEVHTRERRVAGLQLDHDGLPDETRVVRRDLPPLPDVAPGLI